MEPQQPGQLGHDPYDFILNPPNPTSKHPLGGLPLPRIGSNSLVLQIVVLVGGAIVLMIVIALVVSVLTGNKLNRTDLVNLAAEQAELISLAKSGDGMVTQATSQQLAINIELTIETDSHTFLNLLASDGISVSSKQLQVNKNAEDAIQLQNAQQNSTVDTVFAQIMQRQLRTYSNNIKKDYNEATDPMLKSLLKADYAQAQLLLREVPSTTSAGS